MKTAELNFKSFRTELELLVVFIDHDEDEKTKFFNDCYEMFQAQGNYPTVAKWAASFFEGNNISEHNIILKSKVNECGHCDGVGTVEGDKQFIEKQCRECLGLGIVMKEESK